MPGCARVRSTTHWRGSTSNLWLSGCRRTPLNTQPPVIRAHDTQPAGIGRIGPYHPDPVGPACRFSQDQLGSIRVLDVGWVHRHG
jgi:hypothetical protein